MARLERYAQRFGRGILSILFLFTFLQGVRFFVNRSFPEATGCNFGSVFGAPVPGIILITFGICALLILAVQWWKESEWKKGMAWLLLIGAGFSNLWERIQYGCVSDYFHLGFSFNMADTLLTFGVIVLLWRWQAQNQKAKIKY